MIKLYVDSDSVLVNFKKAVQELGPGPAAGLAEDATDVQKQCMYDAIEAAGPGFWANLEWLDGAQELWELVSRLCNNPVILTAPGLFTHAVEGKKEWVRRNLPGASLVVTNQKSAYAERDAILIDDMVNNIGAWQEAGGIGILYKSFPQTEAELLSLIWTRPSIDIN